MMKIKKGDSVKILSGRDAGKTGTVTQVIFGAKKGIYYAVVEGVNQRKKHLKGNRRGEGRVMEFSAPLAMSKLMLVDPSSKKPTRVGFQKDGEKKVRVAKRTGKVIS